MTNAIYRDHMGSDLTVVNNARVSFDKVSTLDENGKLRAADVNLIQYLARGMKKSEWREKIADIITVSSKFEAYDEHNNKKYNYERIEDTVNELMGMAQHWAPFAGTSIQLQMKAPVPIRTQCFKHKVGFVESEESRRYIKSIPELYIPDVFHTSAEDVKQGAGMAHNDNEYWRAKYTKMANKSIKLYCKMIDAGIAPEEARFVLPQGVYVNWIWTGSLASYARYYNQRSDKHSQTASRILAEEVGNVIYPLFPVSWTALCPRFKPKKVEMATPLPLDKAIERKLRTTDYDEAYDILSESTAKHN